jgi:hypothetical protein
MNTIAKALKIFLERFMSDELNDFICEADVI